MQGAMCQSRTEKDGDDQDHLNKSVYSRGASEVMLCALGLQGCVLAHIMAVSH